MDDYTLTGKDKLYLLGLGDLHRGSPEFNEDFLLYWKDMVAKIINPIRLYLMGDLLEAATKALANSSYRQKLSLDDQISDTIDFFKPIIKPRNVKTVVSLKGNHCMRLEKDYDLDVMRLIAEALDCSYGNQYIDEFTVNDRPFRVHVSHGKGSNAYAHLAQGKLIRETQNIDCDLFIQGHNHRLDFFSHPIRTPTTDTGYRRRYYAFSGSFLNYGGYADAMLLPPLLPAFQFMYLDKHSVLNNIDYFIDQRRPDLLMEAGK